MQSIDEIEQNFTVLDDWEERYRYVIELGRELAPLSEQSHSEANRVKGCASQVWLETTLAGAPAEPELRFKGDSDAHIVKGLITIILALYSGRTARAIAATDAMPVLKRLGLDAHLTPQRSNGVRAMVERIKRDAETALREAPAP